MGKVAKRVGKHGELVVAKVEIFQRGHAVREHGVRKSGELVALGMHLFEMDQFANGFRKHGELVDANAQQRQRGQTTDGTRERDELIGDETQTCQRGEQHDGIWECD